MKSNLSLNHRILLSLFILIIGNAFLRAQDEDFRRIGTWAEGPCYAVDVASQVAYYGNGCFLVVVDISNPALPVERTRIETPALVNDIAIQSDYLFVANEDLGLRIFDISGPSDPVAISFFEIPGFYATILPDHDILYYMTNSTNGLYLIDISNVADPAELARFDLGDRGKMALAGDYLLAMMNPYERVVKSVALLRE